MLSWRSNTSGNLEHVDVSQPRRNARRRSVGKLLIETPKLDERADVACQSSQARRDGPPPRTTGDQNDLRISVKIEALAISETLSISHGLERASHNIEVHRS